MHRREGKLIVAATDLVGFLECGHLTNLDRQLADGLLRKPDVGDDPALELLRWRGGEHEKRYIAQLEADGRRITDLTDNKALSYAQQAAATEEQMRLGADVIYQGTVFDGRWIGYPDFLLRVTSAEDGSSSSLSRSVAYSELVMQVNDSTGNPEFAFVEQPVMRLNDSTRTSEHGVEFEWPAGGTLGVDWHYEVADTKLAHTAKASALIQMCSYVEQIDRIQKRMPDKVAVVTGGAKIEIHDFRTAEMMAYYRHAKARFAAELAKELDPKATYPDPVEHCAVCKWFYVQCRQAWRDDDALPLVAGISRKQRATLAHNEITTMRELSELTQPISFEGLTHGQAESLWRMREQARLQVQTGRNDVPAYALLKPERDSAGVLVSDRGLSALPEPSGSDLFFDIEGDPFAFWEGVEYLFGIWDGNSYQAFWAQTRDEEKQQFENVMDLFHGHWKQHPEAHIYHYGSYEPSRLKHLAGRHSTRQDELDDLLRGRVFVDLLRVVRQGVLVGSERYSIKNLEPLYGFTRTIELRDAGSSIVEFEKLLEMGDPTGEIKDTIQDYNKDDTVSTHRLRDWLEMQRPDVTLRPGEVLPRSAEGVLAPGEELSDRIRAVRELEARLTAPIDADPVKQSDADKATWLVAHLLEWHRREQKSSWWRFYELLTHSDDELFADKEPIARLEYVGAVEGGGTRQSDDHRYRFPRQEHDVDEDNEVHDPGLVGSETTKTGTVVAIDKDAGTVDIRRKKEWAGQHPTSIVPLNIFRTAAQEGALMRLGEWVAANGIDAPDAEWRAARDLLLRRAPRLVGASVDGSLKGEGQTGTKAAQRLALMLDGTTLAIQGPPGSGKTWTGARMILDLVRAGRVVGITSNSHKVICNLVKAVIDAVPVGESVRIVQKGKKDEALDHPWVKRVEDNSDVDDALAEESVDVVAGTPWLWAREEIHDGIHTLFVDEAGQVSLANVVAVSGAARNVVLLGDPQQLDQPTQGVHPPGSGVSALTHFLGGAETVPPESGLFLEKTWRMHPRITDYTSELFYEGKLESVNGLERQRIDGADWLAGSGLRWVEVEHDSNTNESAEEARVVVDIVRALIGREWVDQDGARHRIVADDLRIVSPFNAHRLLIDGLLRDAGVRGVPVGTVDKFQGQEAPVSIYTMATSRPEDAPRGMSFLYSLHRLNVATSRAKALAIVVCSPRLLDVVPKTPDQLRMANGLAAFVDRATRLPTMGGGRLLPGVDLDDRAAVLDLLEGVGR